jgi:hypothetical protein
MTKAKLSAETKQVLADLRNRIIQLNEANHLGKHQDITVNQERAFLSVLALIDQLEASGHIYRGNEYIPDPVEPLVTTKWQP